SRSAASTASRRARRHASSSRCAARSRSRSRRTTSASPRSWRTVTTRAPQPTSSRPTWSGSARPADARAAAARAVAGRDPPRPRPRTNLEGFLFPATYDFLRTTTSFELAKDQLTAFCGNWSKVSLAYARTKNLTPYDVLIIASMVEKETLAPDERPLVAAVIYNRLHAGMTLGIDATIRYGLHVPGTQALRQSQLDSDNPYNTRKFAGLPPTPIG